ncbi:exonuclease, dsDNA, ATP-dependent [Escherichia coli]|uniref:Exonuclease, dsDNA, ATP-dependent n=1 Tax=Escherichia coli TaxID=562 RepID=A0A377B0I4_ECOLX|nr:exonuclease, dsDNA, ATP-dependent [Escherichia coli]
MKLLPPWHNMLSNAHCVSAWSRCMGRLVPQQKRLAQLMVTIQNVTLEQTQRNAALNEMRQRYKEKTQQLADVKTICEQEARIKTLEAPARAVTGGSALPTLWFHQPPGGRGVSGAGAWC